MTSCEDLQNLLGDNNNNGILSNEEIVNGLKTALKIGSDTAVSVTSILDGYYKNETIKILLPPEADIIIDNMDKPALKAIGIDKLVENVIVRINRAAEHAAAKAKPIFVDAITGMSIDDGLHILYGTDPLSPDTTQQFDSTAATEYLKGKTFNQLKDLFKPKMDSALNEKIIAGISTNEAWNTLKNAYNLVVDNDIFNLLNLKRVDVDLSDYATGKGLDGLFYMVGREEKKIRLDPYKWVVDIIQKVFGYVKKNPDINSLNS